MLAARSDRDKNCQRLSPEQTALAFRTFLCRIFFEKDVVVVVVRDLIMKMQREPPANECITLEECDNINVFVCLLCEGDAIWLHIYALPPKDWFTPLPQFSHPHTHKHTSFHPKIVSYLVNACGNSRRATHSRVRCLVECVIRAQRSRHRFRNVSPRLMIGDGLFPQKPAMRWLSGIYTNGQKIRNSNFNHIYAIRSLLLLVSINPLSRNNYSLWKIHLENLNIILIDYRKFRTSLKFRKLALATVKCFVTSALQIHLIPMYLF